MSIVLDVCNPRGDTPNAISRLAAPTNSTMTWSYGHAFALLSCCVRHLQKQRTLMTSAGQLCGHFGMQDSTPVPAFDQAPATPYVDLIKANRRPSEGMAT